MTNSEMAKVLDKCKSGDLGQLRAFSISYKNASIDTDDSIYIVPSYDMAADATGHPATQKGIAGKDFVVTTHPANALTNFVETIKHNKLKLKMVRFEADDAATLSSIEVDYTQDISLFSTKGRQESLQLTTYISTEAENRNVVDIKNPPFNLCPTTKVLAKVPFGKTLKVTYWIED